MAHRRILITGAAGMIGSCLVRFLNDRGFYNLVLVDDCKQGEKWKNWVGKRFVDCVSKHSLFDWLKGAEGEIEAIFHLGACSSTVETNVDYLLENNYRYTVRLAEWALRAGVRFIYASSAATYGDGSRGFLDEESALEELRPLNPYAFSKQLVDLWMKQQGVLDRVVGLKYFNIFGPNEYHKGAMASMILKMCHKVQKEGTIQLYRSDDPRFKDGDQCRDFLYVKDAVQMTLQFLQTPTVSGIFNIGQGSATTWNQVAGALFRALGKKERIEYIEMPRELLGQYQNYTCSEMGKFRRAFPTAPPPTSMEEAVREYTQEYLVPQARW
jgi:ADP-L-glycero-D-manno-heptose 6-epimerase